MSTGQYSGINPWLARQSTPKPAKPKGGSPVGTTRRPTTSYTLVMSTKILDSARNAMAFLKEEPDPAAPRSFVALAEAAIYKEVKELQDRYNNGQPFPDRPIPA